MQLGVNVRVNVPIMLPWSSPMLHGLNLPGAIVEVRLWVCVCGSAFVVVRLWGCVCGGAFVVVLAMQQLRPRGDAAGPHEMQLDAAGGERGG